MRPKSILRSLPLGLCLASMLELPGWSSALPVHLRRGEEESGWAGGIVEAIVQYLDCDECPGKEFFVEEYGEEAGALYDWVEERLEEDPNAEINGFMDGAGALEIRVEGARGAQSVTTQVRTQRDGLGDAASVKVTLSKPALGETVASPAAAAERQTAAEARAAKAYASYAAANKSSQATMPRAIAELLAAVNEVYRLAKLGKTGALAAAQAEAAKAYAAFKDYLRREAAAGKNPLAQVPPAAQRLLAAVDSVFRATKAEKAAREAAASRGTAPAASAAAPVPEATAPLSELESRLAALVKDLHDPRNYTSNPELDAITLNDLYATYNALRGAVRVDYAIVNTRWKQRGALQADAEVEVAAKLRFPDGTLVEAIADQKVTVSRNPCPPHESKISRLEGQPPVLYKDKNNTFEVSFRRGTCRRDGALQSGTSLSLTPQGQLTQLPTLQAVIFNCCTLAGVVRASLQVGNTSLTAFNGSVTFNISGVDGGGAYNRAATLAGLAIPGGSLSALLNLLFPPAVIPPASIDNGNCTSAEAASCQLNPGGPLPGLCGLLCL